MSTDAALKQQIAQLEQRQTELLVENERLRTIIVVLGEDPNRSVEDIELDLNRRDIKRIAELLHHDDFEYVQQGIDLCEGFLSSAEDCDKLLEELTVLEVPESLDLSFLRLVFKDGKHSLYLALWFLGTVAQWRDLPVTTLDIRGSYSHRLSELPDTICHLQHLQTLNAANNEISVIPEGFGTLLNLKEVHLQQNRLTVLPDEMTALHQLTTLDVRNNKLSSLPDAIGSLGALNHLYVGGNQLAQLPESIAQLRELQHLTAPNNHLSRLPSGIGSLAKLTFLGMSQNNVSELPAGFERLSALSTLKMSGNRFSEIPPMLQQLPALTEVNFKSNPLSSPLDGLTQIISSASVNAEGKIEATPQIQLDEKHHQRLKYCQLEALCNLPADQIALVTHLDMEMRYSYRDKRLRALPPNFIRLTALETLNLKGNNVSELPADFGNLVNLTTLNIEDNNLRTLPSSFGNLSKLQHWRWDCGDVRLPKSVAKLSLLTHLDLSNMYSCRKLHSTLRHLTQLESLDLRRCGFHDIPSVLYKMKNLKTVFWAYNHKTKAYAKEQFRKKMPTCKVK